MALLAKLRPSGPWRVGPDSGDRSRVGRILHSDALYSALTHAFLELGDLDAWLEATAAHAGGSEVRLSSCFPFVSGENGDTLFLPPPESHWPPPGSLKIRWKSARYVPPTAIWQLLNDKSLVEEHWLVDGVSECLIPVIRNVPLASPFRVSVRSRAAVDRMGQGIETHQTACLEFSKGAGIWIAFNFASKDAEARWSPALKGALKLIADSGLGGERSSGWGRFEQPDFAEGELGALLFGNRYRAPEEITGHWLLSLFSPAADDGVNWQEGNYRMVARTGRVESRAGWGAAKRANNMIAEGGVLVAPAPPKGVARDVAPEGFPHPVYRAGFALTLPIGKAKPPKPAPVVVDSSLLEKLAPSKVEEPAVPEATDLMPDSESAIVRNEAESAEFAPAETPKERVHQQATLDFEPSNVEPATEASSEISAVDTPESNDLPPSQEDAAPDSSSPVSEPADSVSSPDTMVIPESPSHEAPVPHEIAAPVEGSVSVAPPDGPDQPGEAAPEPPAADEKHKEPPSEAAE